MSDISIPGVTSRFDTDKMIQEIMKLERIPLDRMEESVATYTTEKDTWQSLNRRLAQFRDSARSLFGFENPFQDRIAASSMENIVTATAERGIQEDNRTIKVLQLAKADRFLSSSLDRDYKVPEGKYSFRIGDEDISFTFSGGTLTNFADKITGRGKDVISARVVNDTADTQVLLIEGLKTGAANKLEFLDASRQFGLDAGIFTESADSSFSFDLSRNGVTSLSKPLNEAIFPENEQILRFLPGSEARLPITAALPSQDGLQLEIQYKIENLSDNYTPPQRPPGPSIADPGSINVDDVIVANEPSQALTPPWKAPEPPKKNTDLQVFSLQGASASANLPPVQNNDGSYTMKIKLSDYISSPRSLDISNKNTHTTIILTGASIVDPNARGDYRPTNPIDTAQDSKISLDGITVSRGQNSLDDLIPGLSINLHGTSNEPVELTVQPDRQNIKDSIIKFVGYYNQLLTEIQVLTRDDSSIIENIAYLTDEETAAYREKLGLFQGEISLNQLRSRMQQIMMNPYPAENSGDIVLLAQLGISTNASGAGTGMEAARLRGYLEISESTLDKMLETKVKQVQNLFGRDTDGDMVVDSGVAVVTDQYIRPYTQSGGIIAMKMSTIDQQITRTKDSIETLTDRLDSKESKLQQDYGRMEGALQNMEEASRAIGNFNNNQQ